jgi:hypothetical protein
MGSGGVGAGAGVVVFEDGGAVLVGFGAGVLVLRVLCLVIPLGPPRPRVVGCLLDMVVWGRVGWFVDEVKR